MHQARVCVGSGGRPGAPGPVEPGSGVPGTSSTSPRRCASTPSARRCWPAGRASPSASPCKMRYQMVTC